MNWKKMTMPLLLALSLVFPANGISAAAPAKAAPSKAPAPVKAPAAKLPGGPEGRGAYFVTLDWLKDNLKGVVILDARPASLYSGGHIPGAVNAEWQSFSKMSGLPGGRGWATLIAPKALAARIGALGIDGSRPVIIYGEPGSWGQDGFAALVLRAAGVPGVRVLDGGWTAWRAAGLPVSKEFPKPRPANFPEKGFRHEWTANLEHVRERITSAKLLDVRSLEEFRGARYFGEKRGGHIPGSILLPYNQFLGRDGLLLPDGELKGLFERAGLLPKDEIIVYATGAPRSSFVTWVLMMLGYTNVKVYGAGFHEWAGVPELSVETGDPSDVPVLVAAPVPVGVQPVSSDVKSADVKPVPKEAGALSDDVKPQVLKPAPIVVQPVSPDVKSPDVTPVPKEAAKVAGEVKPSVQSKPVVDVARILALRWNKDGNTVRVVVDLDRSIEPRVLVKPNVFELVFNALPAASLAGLASPYGKDVSVVLVESVNQATLRFSHKAKGVKHFKLDKPHRYVVDFQF